MLTEKQVREIKEHLNRAHNPLFFFDNDPDGLCSFILLQRYINKGKGVPIKSFPKLDESYFRKINEFNPDYIFILDKPVVSDEFFERIKEVNIPVVWIDHHEIDNKVPEFVNYYNPIYNKKKSEEPVTALCYQINNNKDLIWLAVAGCISDKFFPDFYSEFKEKYPDLAINSKGAFEIFYDSSIGKIARIFSFALKDRTTNVVNMMKFLIKVKNPYEVLEENNRNRSMHQRFNEINIKYKKLLQKAINVGEKSGKVLAFKFGGELSIAGELANELSYVFSNKFIIVGYVKGAKINISARGKNIRELILKAIEDMDATGGGHEDAVGASINFEDWERFISRLKNT